MSAARIVAVSKVVPRGYWTSYVEVGEVVYGHRHGGQTVLGAYAPRASGHER